MYETKTQTQLQNVIKQKQQQQQQQTVKITKKISKTTTNENGQLIDLPVLLTITSEQASIQTNKQSLTPIWMDHRHSSIHPLIHPTSSFLLYTAHTTTQQTTHNENIPPHPTNQPTIHPSIHP